MSVLRNCAIATMVVAACVLGILPAANAVTLPDISGRWYAQGDHSKPCHITQSGSNVTLTNEVGSRATGEFTDPSTISTSWPTISGMDTISRYRYVGHISNDLTTIHWSNGTYWSRAPKAAFSTSTSSSSVSSGQVAAAAATPKPWRYMHWASPAGPRAPIDYVDAWTAVEPDATAAWTCFSFKNTNSVAATRILFGFLLLNHNHETIDTGHLDRKGTFSPNVEIHGYHDVAEWSRRAGPRGYRDNCVSWKPNAEPRAKESYSQARYYSIIVKRMDYADGTTWPQPEEASPSPEPSPSPT